MTDTKKSLERSGADADPAKVGGGVIRLNDEEHEPGDAHSAETRIGQMADSAIQELMRKAEGGSSGVPQINEQGMAVEEATAQVPAAALLAGLKAPRPQGASEPTPASGMKRVLPKPPGSKTDAPAPPPAPNRSTSKAPAPMPEDGEEAAPASVPRVYDDVSEDDASTRIHPDAKGPPGTRGQTMELSTDDFLAEPPPADAPPAGDVASMSVAPRAADKRSPIPYELPDTRERHWTDYTVAVALIGLVTLTMILGFLFYLTR